MNEFLKQLADRLQLLGGDILSADEIVGFPKSKFNRLISKGVLQEIQQAKGITCDECDDNCFIEPEVRRNPKTGNDIGVFTCMRNPDIGLIKIDLNRLRQWKISRDRLEELGYCKKCTTAVTDDFITLKEAAGLAGVSEGTISRWATDGAIKDNNQTGRGRKISKSSILLKKQSREENQAKQDFDEYQRDISSIPDRH